MHNSFRSSGLLVVLTLALGGAAFGVAACDDTSDGAGGASSSSTTATSASSTTSKASSTVASSSTGMTQATCGKTTELTAAMVVTANANGDAGIYRVATSPQVGDAMETDQVSIEIYGSGFDPSLDGETPGTYDLTAPGDDNYQTCSRCILMRQDIFTMSGKAYFQKSGTITVDATSDSVNGTLNATVTDLTLIEVEIDGDFFSNPIDGGDCIHIASITAAATPPVVPVAWTCPMDFYADGGCDCGCGARDSDCIDGTIDSCEACNSMGSCSATDCPGTINVTDNAVCTM